MNLKNIFNLYLILAGCILNAADAKKACEKQVVLFQVNDHTIKFDYQDFCKKYEFLKSLEQENMMLFQKFLRIKNMVILSAEEVKYLVERFGYKDENFLDAQKEDDHGISHNFKALSLELDPMLMKLINIATANDSVIDLEWAISAAEGKIITESSAVVSEKDKSSDSSSNSSCLVC